MSAPGIWLGISNGKWLINSNTPQDKQGASPNFKRGFGFHPMLAFVDHGAGGTGEPLVGMLRPGKATANDAADQIAVLDAALAKLPERWRRRVLVRGDTGAGVHEFLWHKVSIGVDGLPIRGSKNGTNGAKNAGSSNNASTRANSSGSRSSSSGSTDSHNEH